MRASLLLLAAGFWILTSGSWGFADTSSRRGSVDTRLLRLERTLSAGDDAFFAASASADGRVLAAGRRDGKIALWDGARRRVLEGHEGCVYAAALSPGGRLLASGGADRVVRVWDVEKGARLRELRGHAGTVHAIAFAPDAKRLVSGGADGARVWRTDDGVLVATLKHGAHVLGVALSTERAATAGADGAVRLWDASGRELRALSGAAKPAAAAAFSPDGSLVAAASFDGKIRLWAAETGRLLRTIDAHAGIAVAVAFSPDGRLIASAGADGVRFWDAEGRARGAQKSGAVAATSVAFTPGGAVATFADSRVRVWSARGTLSESPVERQAGFLGVSYSDDGGALVSSVVAGSQAEAVGFRENDLIIGVDAKEVARSEDFLNFMRGTFEGDEVTLRVRREGSEIIIRAKLGRWQ